MNPEPIFRYFPSLSDEQRDRIIKLGAIYTLWNARINVISRKDMENFFLHHVLHSLAIGKIIEFLPGTTVLDVGTGGGFPGIPLAIMFPETEFTLLDSIEKKIRVVAAVKEDLGLANVIPCRKRAEEEKGKFDFVISRAVMGFGEFVKLTGKNISGENRNKLNNGIIYLKGGDLSEELSGLESKIRIWNISEFFQEPFFETKKLVYMPVL